MPISLGSKTRIARKPHRCSMCNVAIQPGDTYRVSTNVFDDRVYDWKSCTACVADHIVSEVYDWAGMPDEGVGYDSGVGWAHDARHAGPGHPEIVRAAEDYLRRVGCTCDRCDGSTPPGGES